MAAVVSQAQRGPGAIDSGDVQIVGIGQPTTSTRYILQCLMNPQDVSDPTLTIGQLTMYLDGQVVFGPQDSQCGAPDRNGNFRAPWTDHSDGQVHTTVRVTANLPRRINFGMDVSLGDMIGLA